MGYGTDGKWIPEDDSITPRLTGLLQKDSPLMQQARTGALQFANKRGLANSSIAATAGESAAINAALPIAAQEASQTAAKNLQSTQTGSTERVAALNVSAHDREKLAAATAEYSKKYGAMFTEVLKNNDLAAPARNAYYQHIAALRDIDMQLLEQTFNVDLDWGTAAPATHVTA